MENLVRNLKVVLRTQTMIAEFQARLLARKAALFALAGLVSLFGLAMLNLAAFFALASTWGSSWSALIVAGGNLVLAVALVAYAASLREGRELAPVRELQAMAVEDLEDSAQRLQDEIVGLREDVKQVRDTLHKPSDLVSPQVIAPILAMVLRMMNRGKKE